MRQRVPKSLILLRRCRLGRRWMRWWWGLVMGGWWCRRGLVVEVLGCRRVWPLDDGVVVQVRRPATEGQRQLVLAKDAAGRAAAAARAAEVAQRNAELAASRAHPEVEQVVSSPRLVDGSSEPGSAVGGPL